MEHVFIGVDPRKLSATMEVVDEHEAHGLDATYSQLVTCLRRSVRSTARLRSAG